jgi:two-component system sensor histidine kinase UhpB
LRLKINLIVGALTLMFVVTLLAQQFGGMRQSVNEEVIAANRVAAQLLNRTAWGYAAQGTQGLLAFLESVGRVRSNDITLLDHDGRELYRSPPSSYKAGRNAPAWFERMVSPSPSTQSIEFPTGKLVVRANASRAVLDAWDDFVGLMGASAALLVAVNALVFWLVGRAVRPFARIVEALSALEAGRFDVSLPRLSGTEASAIGAAFNRMVRVLQENIANAQRAALAERQLSDSRDMAHWLDRHIEQERRVIARELHDELGQSVTAMRSMALSIAQRVQRMDPESERAARLIADESSHLYDAMHGLIPRLTPLVLDNLGLEDALRDLVERVRRSQADVRIELDLALGGPLLPPDASLVLYRAAQEGITNALRHGHAGRVCLRLRRLDHSVMLEVIDDGRGLALDWSKRNGHHGLRWLDERVQAAGGRFEIEPQPAGGVRLAVHVPFRVQEKVQ